MYFTGDFLETLLYLILKPNIEVGKTPIYINEKNGQLIFNPKELYWLKLWQMPAEFWDVNFDITSVLS